ncbi:MAG: hypothetical protein ACI8RD_004037, partial [Bacillariaceae sp.]
PINNDINYHRGFVDKNISAVTDGNNDTIFNMMHDGSVDVVVLLTTCTGA